MCASDSYRGAAAAGLLCIFAMASAFGQQQPTREQELIRRLRQQLQQLQQEQSTQQQAAQRTTAEKIELQGKLDKATASVGQIRASVAAQTGRATKAQQEAAALAEERDRMQARVAETQAELERTAQRLDQTGKSLEQSRVEVGNGQRTIALREAAFTALDERHALQSRNLQTCAANNQALFSLGHELLTRYANKGVGEAMAAAEPFLQSKRVALENLVQGYEDKLDHDKVKPDTGANLAR